MDKQTSQEMLERAAALRESLAAFGIEAKPISMEDASTIYQKMLAEDAAKLIMQAACSLSLLAIASRPTKAEAMRCFGELIQQIVVKASPMGAELIKDHFDEEKAHTTDKLDLICKTAIGL